MVSNTLSSHLMNLYANRQKWVPASLLSSSSSSMFQGVLQLPGRGFLNFGHFWKSSHFPAISVFTKIHSPQTLQTKCIIWAAQVLLVPASTFVLQIGGIFLGKGLIELSNLPVGKLPTGSREDSAYF